MHQLIAALTCLACASQGRRVHTSLQQWQRRPLRSISISDVVSRPQLDGTEESSNPVEVLEALLKISETVAAFTPSYLRMVPRTGDSYPIRSGLPADLHHHYRRSVAQLATSPSDDSNDEGIVVRLAHPHTGQQVTIIGTQHLSVASQVQVARELRSIQPDVVVVELDRGRLPRLNLSDADFVVPYRTSDDIVPPPAPDDIAEAQLVAAGNGWWWRPVWSVANDVGSQVVRKVLTNFYGKASKEFDGATPGGEFAEAISAANELRVPCVLADRDSIGTIARAIELVRRSDKGIFGILDGLSDISENTFRKAQQALQERGVDPQEITTSELVEEVKKRPDLIESMKKEWRMDVPEFSRAFVEERDYIMAKAIDRELDKPVAAKHVCAVVGVGHLYGIQSNLETAWKERQASPAQEVTSV